MPPDPRKHGERETRRRLMSPELSRSMRMVSRPLSLTNKNSPWQESPAYLRLRLAIGAVLSLLLWVPVALADEMSSGDPPPRTDNRGGGSRGCSMETAATPDMPALILLAPTKYLGKTVATHPTFAWFVSAPGSWQMEFRLYEYDPVSDKVKLIQEIKDGSFKSSPGIMVLSLSKSMPNLSVGRRYLWQVELNCNPSKPSGNPFAEAELKVVELEPALRTELSAKNHRSDLAAFYLKAGLWYDALSTVLTISPAEDEPRIRQLRSSLLEKVAMGEKEINRFRESAVNQIQR